MQALEHERRLAARERDTLAEESGEAAGARTGAAESRGHVQATARRADRGAAARRAPRDRRGRRSAEGANRRARGRRRAARRAPPGDSDRRDRGGARRGARGDRRDRRAPPRPRARHAPPRRPRRPNPAAPPAIGDRVLVGAFGLEGVVQALHDREAEVDVRGKRLRARVDELRVVAPASAVERSARHACGSTSICSRATRR